MRFILTLGLVGALLAGCSGGGGSGKGVDVVVGFYPLAEAAAQVGGNGVDVKNLTSAGTEPHDIELGSDDIDAIDGADLVVVMGHGFQPALEKAAAHRHGPTLVVLDELGVRGNDPHIWLDPQEMVRIVRAVAGALAKVDAANADTYGRNADFYSQKLATLAREMGVGLQDCQRRTVVTAHEAFGHLASAYRLRQEGIAGIDPQREPDPARIAALVDLVKREGVTTIFTEKLVSPKVAEVVAREAGVKVAVLNPLEGLTTSEIGDGADYLSVMRGNLAALRTALACA